MQYGEIPYQRGIYEGELHEGVPHGHGTYTCESFSYTGSWSEGAMSGTGEISEADGRKYTGGFQADRKHGRGVFTHPNGVRYEGYWKDDLRHGPGTLFFPDGSRKEGLWEDDRLVGEIHVGHDALNLSSVRSKFIRQVLSPGDKDIPFLGGFYRGGLEYGLPNGTGIYSCEVSVYEGEWVNGRKSGKGILTEGDGTIYVGEWKDDKRNGMGVETSPFLGGFARYEGEWKQDKRHGHGVLRTTNGTIYEGQWRNDAKNGHGIEVSTVLGIKVRYEGEWRDSKKHGKGVEISIFKGIETLYEGEWRDNRKFGLGLESRVDLKAPDRGKGRNQTNKKVKIHTRLSRKTVKR